MLEACERRELLSTIVFDPDGAGGAHGDRTITALDWNVGNSVSVNAVPTTGPGQTFDTLYQARLASTLGDITPISGLNVNGPGGFELTIVAKFREVVNFAFPVGSAGTALFTSDADQAASFLEIYYDSYSTSGGASQKSNDLEGTGFDDGHLILTAEILPGAFGDSIFTSQFANVVRLDQAGADNRGGQLTISGSGAALISAQVNPGYDGAFFKTPGLAIVATLFNSSLILPFRQVEPSKVFFNDSAVAGREYAPTLGTVNGVSGPDILFQADANQSFLTAATAALGDFVWYDLDVDGLQDTDEPGVPGVTVKLLDSTGTTTLATTTTDANGGYSFINLVPGSYVVQFVPPAGRVFTAQDVFGNILDAIDSDADTTTGRTGVVTLSPGEVDPTIDAGLLPIDLMLTKDVDNPTPEVGTNVVFTVTVSNATGLSTATGVTVRDVLPAGLSFVSSTASQGSYDGLSTWTVGTLAPGASATLLITATVTTGGTKTNFAQVQTANEPDIDSTPGNDVDNTPNEDDEDDASLTPPAAIGDFLWLDTNRNGQQDSGEPGIDGVPVQLLDGTGTTVIASTTTGDDPNLAGTQNGYYAFTGLTPGTYVVRFFTGGGYDRFTTANVSPDATDSDANTLSGLTGPYTLASGEFNRTVDAGLLPIDLELTKGVNNPTPAVGSNVIFTVTVTNNNAAPGVSTATGVSVRDALPAGLAFVTSSASQGSYSSGTNIWTVGTLGPGASATLSITATVTTGGTKTNFAQVQTADQVDTDSTPGNDIDNTPNEDDEDDASLTPPAAIGDFLWLDTNRNGQQDSGEPGIDGVPVQLLDGTGTTVLATTSTGDDPNLAGIQNGYYAFSGLAPGTYVVRFFTGGGYDRFTTANIGPDATDSDADTTTGLTGPYTLASGEFNRTVDAGLLPIDLELTKTVDNATPAVGSNVVFTVTVTNNNAAPGVSTATGVTVRDALPAGLAFVSSSASQGSYSNVTNIWTVGTLAPGASVTLAITATVTSGGTKTNFAQVQTAGQIDTDSTPGNNTDTGTRTPYEDDEDDASVTPPAAIGDFLWLDRNRNGHQDAGEPGIDGVPVQLRDATGTTVLASTTTGDDPNTAGVQNGYYAFTGLAPGTYTVRFFTGGGYDRFTTANVGPDATDSDADTTTGLTGPYTLSSGEFNRTVDAGLLPIDLELTKSVNNSTPAVGSNVDFTVTVTNNNAAPGVSTATGVTVRDDLPAGLTFVSSTASQGSYSNLTNLWTVGTLAPGASATLTITATVTSGGTKTNFAQVQTANQVDTDSTPGNDVDNTPNEDDEDDASLTPPAALGDFVFRDLDADGVQDPGEPGVPDVIVQLLDGTGTTVLGADVTDSLGIYGFAGLAPGTYVVRFFAPGGSAFSPQFQGGNPALDSNPNPATGITPGVTLVSGQTDLTIDAGLVAVAPDIHVEKFTNGFDANDPNGPLPMIPIGNAVNWLYLVTNTGNVAIPRSQLVLTDSDPSVNPLIVFDPTSDVGADNILSPNETWIYRATAAAQDLTNPSFGTTVVPGCGDGSPTYENIAIVKATVNGVVVQDDDPSHYCNPHNARIGDFVWLDRDRDGQQDAGEPGIDGVTVQLLNGTGTTVLASTTTGDDPNTAGTQNGYYEFNNLSPGPYVVRFSTGGGYDRFTTANVGPDATDSDADAATGLTAPTTLSSGEFDRTVDAGLLPIDLELTKDVNNPAPALNTNVIFTITVTNNNTAPGVSTATNVTVTDDLVAGLTFVSSSASQGSYNSATDVWTIGTLAPGAVATLTITATVTTPGSKTNYAQVTTATQIDTDSTPNNGTPPDPNEDDEDSVPLATPAALPRIDIEKSTNGPSNSNPTAPDFDNEDAPNGPGVPILTPGTPVTWTYKVTNTGNVTFTAAQVAIVDDNGTPGNTADDLSIGNGRITFQGVVTGDADNLLEPGEAWLYAATGTVQTLTSSGASGTFDFSGSSPLDGPDGNIRTFSAGGVSVKASGFSRDKATGDWSPAYLGSFGGGLGVTDGGEGDGTGNQHTVDNVGRDNYVLFEFSEAVVVDSAFLGYVVDDSDLTVWIGTAANPFNNHLLLDDAVLSSLGFTEVNLTELTTTRTADLNSGKVAGNVLVIASWTADDTPEDKFKIEKVTFQKPQTTIYENRATVSAPGAASDSDLSHYKNPATPTNPRLDIQKSTNGPTNANPTAPDFDNEDAADGPGVPSLTAGTPVTWTYKVTNTGDATFTAGQVAIVDDNGTPANTADDLSIANGRITFQGVVTGDADTLLEPGEAWLYAATGTVQTLTPVPGTSSTFDFSGSSPLDGPDGNIRTFTAGSVSVKASAFSRDKGTGGWSKAYLGSYGGGLGVTDDGEGDGGDDKHTVDNVGRDNYVLFEFSEAVVVDSAFLGYVVGDSDLTAWIGTVSDAFNNHVALLSDALLTSLGFTEVNLTDSSGTRTADLNPGNRSGNVLVIAAYTADETPEDRFKIEKVTFRKLQPGIYENRATVAAPGVPTDSDLSHYKNSAAPMIDLSLTKTVNVAAPALNTNVVYTVKVSNAAGFGTATGVTVKDLLPAGLTFVSSTAGTAYNSTTGIWTVGTLAAGASATMTITAKVTTAGTKVNYAQVQTADQVDRDSTPGNGQQTPDEDDDASASVTPPLVSLGDFVWRDTNANGQQDGGEPGVAGVTVKLLNAAGTTVLATATTGATGLYSFANLAPGSYVVQFFAPAGQVFTAKDQGADATDSDAAADGKTGVLALVAGDLNTTVDAGLLPADLSLTKTVNTTTPDLGGNVVFTIVVSNAAGFSAATGVTVKDLLPAGLTFVSSSAGTAYVPTTGIWTVGTLAGGAGATLTLTATVATIGAKTNLAQVQASGLVDRDSTPGNAPAVNEDDNASATVTPRVATLGDFVWRDVNANGQQDSGEPGVAAVTVKLLKADGITLVATTTTGATGLYSFANVAPGSYVVQFFAPAGQTFTAKDSGPDATDSDAAADGKTGLITLAGGQTNTTVDAGLLPVDLSLTKTASTTTPDLGKNVVFTISLSNAAGFSTATGVTVKDLLPAGLTFVSATASLGSYVSTTGIWTVGTLAGGAGATLTITATAATVGAKVNLAQVQAAGLVDRDSTPGNAPAVNEDDSASVTVTPLVATLGNFAWRDTNANGRQDSGEAGVAGVAVKLLKSDGTTLVATTTTNATGNYSFTNLAPGSYVVQFVAPTGQVFTAKDQADFAIDSDADVATGKTAVITLAGGETNNNIDAGLLPIDLSLTQTVNNATQKVGQNIVITLTISNAAGFSTATGVTVKDLLPAGLTFVSATASLGSYVGGTGIWTVGTLAGGASATLIITAKVATAGNKVNLAQVQTAVLIDRDSTVGNAPGVHEDDDASITIQPT